jgi:tetratricopeptide (TPR) repeat protein
MKEDLSYFDRLDNINRRIFIGLLGLVTILLIFGLVFHFVPGFNEFSKKDFENELMGQAYFAAANNNYDAEIKLYFGIMEEMPEIKPELYLKIGKAFYNKQEDVEAIRHFINSLESGYADSAEVFFNIAMGAQRLGKLDIAVDYYTRASFAEDYSDDANFNLGNIYFMEKKNVLALESYLKALKEKSVYSCYRDMLRREMKIYNNRKYPEIYRTLKEQLKIEKDEEFFSKFDVAELSSSGSDQVQAIINNNVGIIYAMEDRDSLALQHFQKAMEIDPQFRDAIFNYRKITTKTSGAGNI